MSVHLSPDLCERHELLWLKLSTLLRQTEAIAARRPDAPVSAAGRSIAEALLYDAQLFAPTGTRRGLVATAADSAGLAAQLGQALAALEAFETRHSAYNPALRARCWQFGGGKLPVRRLKPELAAGPEGDEPTREQKEARRMVLKLIDAKFEAGYDRGYADAQNGILADSANARLASAKPAPEQKMSNRLLAGV